jgi:hypothetical protein
LRDIAASIAGYLGKQAIRNCRPGLLGTDIFSGGKLVAVFDQKPGLVRITPISTGFD